nr:hypothetical protein [Veillonella denticariosi]
MGGNYKNYHLVISKFILACFDYIGIVLGGILSAYYLRLSFTHIPLQSNFKMEDIYVYAVIPAIFLFVLLLNNAYSVAAPYWDTIKAIFRSITISVVVSIVLMYTGACHK